jgi:membrane associated rhomboid family serine protease
VYGRNRFSTGGGFPGMTPMVQRIIIACGVIWVLQLALQNQGVPVNDLLAVSTWGVLHGRLWQPFTYMWLHSTDTPWHLVMNMFSLWMFGGQLETVWGSRRFLRFYLICGAGAGAIIFLWNLIVGMPFPTLGASGAIYGVLTAFSLLWPDRTIMLLFPPIPLRAIWFIPFLFAMQLALGGGENVSTVGHLGGVIVAGILLRAEVQRVIGVRSLRYRWHRMRMRNKLRAVRRDEWEKRQRERENDDSNRPTFH